MERGACFKVCVLLLVVLMTCKPVTVSAQVLDQVVVLFDASHSPQFAPDDDEQGLGLILKMVNSSTRYMVRVHKGSPLNTSILDDVDILIVASPDKSNPFSRSEILAISESIANGTSLLVLGDPCIDQKSKYWSTERLRDMGENIALNQFLDSLNISAVRFSINYTVGGDAWGDTMFDYDHALNKTSPSVIRLGSASWASAHPIFRNINELVLMTSTLKPLNSSTLIGRSEKSSFAQFRKGPNTFANLSFPNMSLEEFRNRPLSYSAINGTFPSWLSAFEYGSSRVVISGSTIMFSGLSLDLPSSDARKDDRWFYTADNSKLFLNILSWLSERHVSPPSAITQVLIVSSVLLAVGVLYYVVRRE
ncbi:MAG: hypothetical protein QXS20_00920 [Candidatus Thorarchaeota archaeon]